MEKTDYIRTAVRLDFASRKIDAVDEFGTISQAVDFAASNLKNRYDIILEPAFISEENSVIVYIKILRELEDGFNYGKHLRGISAYLMRNYKDRYEKFFVSPRLLTYTVVGHDYIPKTKNQSELELYLIKKFINLISCSSIDELVQLEKILEKFKYMPIRR